MIIVVDDGARILIMWCRPLRGLILGMVLIPTAVAVGYYVSPTSWVCGRPRGSPLHWVWMIGERDGFAGGYTTRPYIENEE